MENDIKVRTALADVCQYPVSIITGLEIPEITPARMAASRLLCSENRCGNYGRSWTCPPNCGSPEKCAESALRFTGCAVMHRRYTARLDDRARVESVLHAFQEICRNAKRALEMNGMDCLVMAGGPCTFCAECSIFSGQPCRYPDRQIPSVSIYGIDVAALLRDNGIEVEQPEGTLTLFGVILYRSPQSHQVLDQQAHQ